MSNQLLLLQLGRGTVANEGTDMIFFSSWLMICSKIKAVAEVKAANLVSVMLRCAVGDVDLRSEAMFQELVKRYSVK